MIVVFLVTVAVNPANAVIPNLYGIGGDSIDTATSLSCEGVVFHVNVVEWEQSSTSLHDPPLDQGGIFVVWFDAEGNPHYGWTADPALAELLGEPVPRGEIRSNVGYFTILQAGHGNTSLARSVRVSSRDPNPGDIAAMTHVAFHSGNDRNMAIFADDLALDVTAAHRTEDGTSSIHLLTDDSPFHPPFCEFVEMGSRALIAYGAISTDASAEFYGRPPQSTTAMDYSIISGNQVGPAKVTGTVGELEAYVRARAGEGLMFRVFSHDFDEFLHLSGFVPVEPSWIEYAEHTTAEGAIRTFTKEMHFRSGILR